MHMTVTHQTSQPVGEVLTVQASTEDVPGLLALIERRRALGQDRPDEVWDGVYRIMTDPTPEHQRIVTSLVVLIHGRLSDPALEVFPGINIGVDKQDYRIPDVAVVRRDTPRTSNAFLTSSELVVEILSRGERAGERLAFYAAWNVKEYLEIDPRNGSIRLLANQGGEWHPGEHSVVIELTVADIAALL